MFPPQWFRANRLLPAWCRRCLTSASKCRAYESKRLRAATSISLRWIDIELDGAKVRSDVRTPLNPHLALTVARALIEDYLRTDKHAHVDWGALFRLQWRRGETLSPKPSHVDVLRMFHPSHADLDRYRLNELCDTDLRAVSNHLLWCSQCRRTALDAAELEKLIRSLASDVEAVEEFTTSDR